MRTISSIKRKLGLFGFAAGVGVLFIAASTTISGKSIIRNRTVISEPGTYTVGQDIDLSADTSGLPVITITSGGVVLDLDGHTLTGADGVAVIDVWPSIAAEQLVVIRDGRVQGGEIGIRTTGATARYENMLVTEAVSHLIDATNSDIDIFSVKLRLAGGSALNISGLPGHDAVVSDTTILGTGDDAVHVHGGSSLALTRTTIREAALCGLMVSNDTASASEVAVTDSQVIGSGRDGFHLAGKVALTVERGLLRDIGRHGVYVAGSDQPVSVKDTYEQDVGELGVKVHGGGTTELTGNRIRGVGRAGVLGSGAGIEIDGNGGPAVVTIRDNFIDSHGPGSGGGPRSGIMLRPGTTARVLDNVIGGVELGIVPQARNTLIEGNQLGQIGVTGISLLNDGAVARRNSIWAGAGATAGILAGNGNHNILIEDNQIGGFVYGVKGDGPDVLYFYLRDNTFTGNGTHVVGGTDAGGNIFGYLNSYPTEL